MILIDLLKVLTPDTEILVSYRGKDIFQGEAELAMIDLTLDEVEMNIECVWNSRNIHKAIVVEVE